VGFPVFLLFGLCCAIRRRLGELGVFRVLWATASVLCLGCGSKLFYFVVMLLI